MGKIQVSLIRNLLQDETTPETTTDESTPLLRTPFSNIDQNLERGNLDGTPIVLK